MSDGLCRRLWGLLHREAREDAGDDRIGTIYEEAAERLEHLERERDEARRIAAGWRQVASDFGAGDASFPWETNNE